MSENDYPQDSQRSGFSSEDDIEEESYNDGDTYDDGTEADGDNGEEQGDEDDDSNEEDEDDDEDEDEGEDEDDDDDEDGSEVGDEEEYDDEYDEEAGDRDEYEEEKEGDDNRGRCLWATLCCICLILIIIAIILGILLPRKKKNKDLPPTMAPTLAGGLPTLNPASETVPEQAANTPNGDTTIFKGGPEQSEPQGEENLMMVQNGSSEDPNFPDTYALMNYHWDDQGYPWFNEDDLADYDVEGIMCLEHVPNTNQGSNEPTTYSMCRLPSTFPGEDLETATSTGYNYVMPTDCMGQDKVEFEVRPTDETVCVDVSRLIDVHPPFVSSQTSPTSRRRGLQALQENGQTGNNFKNMLFMLDNLNEDPRSTDEFYTRQSGPRSPTLKMNMTPKNGGSGGGGSESTGGENEPVNAPASAPTDQAPTDSTADTPTAGPTATSAPSTSNAPSTSPAPVSAPTVSPAPSFEARYEPCGICGDGPSDQPLNDFFVELSEDLAPPQADGGATCQELEELCLGGQCKPEVCDGMDGIRSSCGCENASGPTFCSICPAQTTMTKPEEDIKELLTPYVDDELIAPLGEEGVNCGSVDSLCQDGQCGPDVCLSIPSIVAEACGCDGTGTGGGDGGSDPVVPAPTPPPTTAVPTVSAAPSYKAEHEVCGICGDGPTPNPLKEDVPIEVPDHLAPPQVTGGKAYCAELESYCQGGYCKPLTCRVLKPIRGLCGCPNGDPPCSICGSGKKISNADATVTVDSSIAIPGFDQSLSCGQMNDLCSEGFCDPNRCEAYPAEVTEACGCVDTTAIFSLSSQTDATIYRDGPLKSQNVGSEDSMLVQKGQEGNDDLPPSYSLIEFTMTQSDVEEIEKLSFAIIELCLTHVENAEPDRTMSYDTCVVANVDGGVESKSGEEINFAVPESCQKTEAVAFKVSPNTGRVCAEVTKMVRDNLNGVGSITFIIDAADDLDQPGDRFYTQEDTSGRQPILQLVNDPY